MKVYWLRAVGVGAGRERIRSFRGRGVYCLRSWVRNWIEHSIRLETQSGPRIRYGLRKGKRCAVICYENFLLCCNPMVRGKRYAVTCGA